MFFMYHPRTRPTGQVLAEALGLDHGTTTGVRQDILLRWGTERRIEYRATQVINNTTAIERASQKYESLRTMREAGVPVPRASTSPQAVRAPFLGRDFSHTQGRDIVLCMQEADAERTPKDYYVEYVPTQREYRVHVAFGEVIKTSEKVLTDPSQSCGYIRNHGHGYTFRQPRTKLGSLGQAVSVDAVRALGLDFGAVDLIIGDDSQTYVLEVNTGPACNRSTAEAYVKAFAGALNLGEDQYDLSLLSGLEDTEDEPSNPEVVDSTENGTSVGR